MHVKATGYFDLMVPVAFLPSSGCELYAVQEEEIAIRCISSSTGKPIPNASVVASTGWAEQVMASTNELGEAAIGKVRFWLEEPIANLSPPEYKIQLTVTGEGFLDKTSTIEVRPGELWGKVELLLEPAQVFTVSVRSCTWGA